MKTAVIATCASKPALQPGEARLAKALEARGLAARPAPWNGAFDPFAGADLVVVRSTWDYPEHVHDFRDWIGRLEEEARSVANEPGLMRWNLEKTYLLDLADRGAPLPPTRLVAPEPDAIAAAMAALRIDAAIVKPVVGASARGLSRVAAGDPEGLAAAAARLGGPGLVQPVLSEVGQVGETSMIFFGGVYSHAVLKRPAAGDIRSQKEFGANIEPLRPRPRAVAEAARILSLCPGAPVYARIDVVVLDERLWLMEVELIEPDLFYDDVPGAADRFADALIDRLES